MGYFDRFRTYLPLLGRLVERDFKAKYKRSVVGVAWSVINPLFQMMILVLVFSTLLGRDIANFPLYIICGRLIFSFFSEATTMCQFSVLQGASFITKVSIPIYILPLSKVLSSLINAVISILAMAIVMIVTGALPSFTTLLFPLPLIYTFLFSLGVGMLLATATVFYRDMTHLYGLVTMTLMFITPLFYSEDIYPHDTAVFFHLNPLLHLVRMFRNVVYLNTVPSLQENLICIGFSALFLLMGGAALHKNRTRLVLHI